MASSQRPKQTYVITLRNIKDPTAAPRTAFATPSLPAAEVFPIFVAVARTLVAVAEVLKAEAEVTPMPVETVTGASDPVGTAIADAISTEVSILISV